MRAPVLFVMGVDLAPHPGRFTAQINRGGARGRAGRHKLGTMELIRPDRRDDHGRTLAHRIQTGRLSCIRPNQRQIVWCADVGTHLLELVGRASRDCPGWSIVAAIGRRQILGDETAGVTRRAIDDEVEVPLHDVGPPRAPGELSSDPCAIAPCFIRITGRHRVAHDREGTPVDPGKKLLGDVWGHVVAPRM